MFKTYSFGIFIVFLYLCKYGNSENGKFHKVNKVYLGSDWESNKIPKTFQPS